MARIYYKEERLSGQAFSGKIIHAKLFNFIFNNTNENKFELQDVAVSSFFGLAQSKKEVFRTVLLLRDGIHYKATEGNFYLPKAIIFFDISDYSFPTQFYFIAKIGKEIELRKCTGGKDVKWFQVPDLHEPLTDAAIISKMERSMLEIKNLVETTHSKKADIARKEQEALERKQAEANRPFLNNTQEEAYSTLIEMCMQSNAKKKQVLKFIETLKNYDKDEEYFTTLNYVIQFLEEKKITCVMRLDWKAGIEDLEWLLQQSLKSNFNLSLILPGPDNYAKNASVSYDNVFEDFDKPLRQHGLQMGFIDTQSDEYIVLLHKITDKQKVENAVEAIGYKYYEK